MKVLLYLNSSTFTPRFLIWKKEQHFRLEKWKKKSPKQSIVQIGKFLILLLVVDYDLGRSDKGKTENQVVPALLCWKYAKRNCIVIFFWNYAYVILFVKLKLCFANSGLFNDLQHYLNLSTARRVLYRSPSIPYSIF